MATLDDFLGIAEKVTVESLIAQGIVKRGVSDSAETPVPEAAEEVATQEEPSEEPTGVVEVELPSGIQVYYQEKPKRLYRVRSLLDEHGCENWVEVPSMSTVTKILDKPGLVHWGEKVGINMVQELTRRKSLDLGEITRRTPADGSGDPEWFTGERIQELGKSQGLGNYSMKDAAASRGTSVHLALEGWAMSGDLADPDMYPEHEKGYVVGLNRFLSESGIIPKKSEVIVASVAHKVAGRFDLVGELPKAVNLVYHLTGKSEKRKMFPAGTSINDLKTSKGVYDDHHLQVAGYKGCMVESGYEEPERGYVLRVTPDGRYEYVDLAAEWLDFWWLRGLYDALESVKKKAHQNYRKELV